MTVAVKPVPLHLMAELKGRGSANGTVLAAAVLILTQRAVTVCLPNGVHATFRFCDGRPAKYLAPTTKRNSQDAYNWHLPSAEAFRLYEIARKRDKQALTESDAE